MERGGPTLGDGRLARPTHYARPGKPGAAGAQHERDARRNPGMAAMDHGAADVFGRRSQPVTGIVRVIAFGDRAVLGGDDGRRGGAHDIRRGGGTGMVATESNQTADHHRRPGARPDVAGQILYPCDVHRGDRVDADPEATFGSTTSTHLELESDWTCCFSGDTGGMGRVLLSYVASDA